MKDSIYVSGSNYFNQEDLNNMIDLLDKGNSIEVGIDCIGHTRNNMEQEAYKKALKEHYGNKLEIKQNDGVCSYNYCYKLYNTNEEINKAVSNKLIRYLNGEI